jgi:hypothetical protein
MLMRRFLFFSFCALLALGSGCRSTRTCVEQPFPGLKEELIQANTNGGRLRLLIVHGMSSHTQGYSSNFVDTIGRKLKLGTPVRQIQTFTNSEGAINGFLTRIDFTNENRNLRAYELTWSPVTQAEKSKRFEFDSRLDKRRATLNRRMKTELLNDGFGDAVLYLNENFKPKIQAPVTNAIFSILGDGFAPADQFIIITHSLGSKLTFDSLNILAEHLRRDDKLQAVAMTNLALHTTYLVMLANQVPLLRLGDTNVITDQERRPSAVQEFLQMRQQGKEQHGPERPPARSPFLQVIAVTDANDLLSYPLRGGDLFSDSIGDIEFGNVLICNAPVFMHWIANPLKAHEGYFDNPKLIKLLIKGSRTTPKSCIKEVKGVKEDD